MGMALSAPNEEDLIGFYKTKTLGMADASEETSIHKGSSSSLQSCRTARKRWLGSLLFFLFHDLLGAFGGKMSLIDEKGLPETSATNFLLFIFTYFSMSIGIIFTYWSIVVMLMHYRLH